MSSFPSLAFDNRFARLPEQLFTRLSPTPVAEPSLFAFNDELGAQLGIDRQRIGDATLAEIFSGNSVPVGSEPLAAAYAGHQFGHWSGMLGDGRAVLLGEISCASGEHVDIQLKGSGPTPYSRGGDGRAWLGPVIREYLVSNAMPKYQVPSTLALAAVSTGEYVLREQGPLPGAVLTRVAKSHIRVGTFEYLAAKQDVEGTRAVIDLLIDTHYPELKNSENPAVALLNAVIEKQANLIARWQALGFIHGVMNTDNASLTGETIDYGPCAFMDEFNRSKVFSSIDQQGRYAYQNQPRIGHWNMAMLAQALLPVLAGDEPVAIQFAQTAVDHFPQLYANAYTERMREKFGLFDSPQTDDMELMDAFLDLMQADSVDFTLCFRHLCDEDSDELEALFSDREKISEWIHRWHQRLNGPHNTTRMQQINPAVIPRNHWIEATIEVAVQGDWTLFQRFETALRNPFVEHADFSQAPEQAQRVQATFCGT